MVIFGNVCCSRFGVEKWYLLVIVKNFFGVLVVYGLISVFLFVFICV